MLQCGDEFERVEWNTLVSTIDYIKGTDTLGRHGRLSRRGWRGIDIASRREYCDKETMDK